MYTQYGFWGEQGALHGFRENSISWKTSGLNQCSGAQSRNHQKIKMKSAQRTARPEKQKRLWDNVSDGVWLVFVAVVSQLILLIYKWSETLNGTFPSTNWCMFWKSSQSDAAPTHKGTDAQQLQTNESGQKRWNKQPLIKAESYNWPKSSGYFIRFPSVCKRGGRG